ncbi:MAG: hypothetical protein ABIU87_10135 [Ornithinibacter sp.]
MNDPAATNTGPGFLAFVAFFVLALVLWFLMKNMNARMRRMSYRQQAAHRGDDEPQVTESELTGGVGEVPGAAVPSASPDATPATGQSPGSAPREGAAKETPDAPGGTEGKRD